MEKIISSVSMDVGKRNKFIPHTLVDLQLAKKEFYLNKRYTTTGIKMSCESHRSKRIDTQISGNGGNWREPFFAFFIFSTPNIVERRKIYIWNTTIK